MGKQRPWEPWWPALAMVGASAASAAMNVFLKKALDDGLNCMLLVTMRQLVASIFLGPIAYFLERGRRPKLTWKILTYVFMCALIGVSVAQYLFFVGLQYTSATFGCAFINLMPVLTFLFALIFRIEEIDYKSFAGKAKVLAIVICLGGVAVLLSYKGMTLTHAPAAEPDRSPLQGHSAAAKWVIGASVLLAACVCWSSWFLVQSKLVKDYPCLYSGNALMFFLGFLQSAVLTIATQRGVSLRQLAGKMEIITVLYAGVVGSGLALLAMSWCVKKRGPVFTTAFSPLIQVLAAVLDFSVLHEPLHLGVVLGSVVLICGLYTLLWAKNKESKSCVVKPVEEATADQDELQQRSSA